MFQYATLKSLEWGMGMGRLCEIFTIVILGNNILYICPFLDISFLPGDSEAQGGDREGLAEDGQDCCYDRGRNQRRGGTEMC